MMIEEGLVSIPTADYETAVDKYKLDGWRIFTLPSSISSKVAFFEGIRSTLPLDPPVQGNQVWEALSDSLWSGLDALSDDRILIVWPDSLEMERQAPRDFHVALQILSELPGLLSDEGVTAGPTKALVVLRLI